MTRAQIIAEAREWLGTPWLHQACVKGVGVDCLHFVAGVGRNVGASEAAQFFATPAWHNYGRHPDAAALFAGCDAIADSIPIGQAQPGDALVLTCGRHPMHFGILTTPDSLIHAYYGAGVVEHRIDERWRKRIVRAYRMRGVE